MIEGLCDCVIAYGLLYYHGCYNYVGVCSIFVLLLGYYHVGYNNVGVCTIFVVDVCGFFFA